MAELWRFPVKSMQGCRVERLDFDEKGADGRPRPGGWSTRPRARCSRPSGGPRCSQATGRARATTAPSPSPSPTAAPTRPATRPPTPPSPPGSTTRCDFQQPPAGDGLPYELPTDAWDDTSPLWEFPGPAGRPVRRPGRRPRAHHRQPAGRRGPAPGRRPGTCAGSGPTPCSTSPATASSRTPGSAARRPSATRGPSPFMPTVRCALPTREQPGLPKDPDIARTLQRRARPQPGPLLRIGTPGTGRRRRSRVGGLTSRFGRTATLRPASRTLRGDCALDPRVSRVGGLSSLMPSANTSDERPLRIAYLAYRGKPHVGGQGVYTRHLTKALVDLGHHVEVYGGNPYPILDERVPLHELPSLDIYNDHFPMRMPGIWELKNWTDFVEVTSFSFGQFPEPLAFSLAGLGRAPPPPGRLRPRARQPVPRLRPPRPSSATSRCWPPSTTPSPSTGASRWSTPRPPTSGGRSAAGTRSPTCRPGWPSRCKRVVTVSENSFEDIHRDHGVPRDRMAIVPVGVDPDLFQPIPGVERIPGRLITTASADVTMKGLSLPARGRRQAAHRAGGHPHRHRQAQGGRQVRRDHHTPGPRRLRRVRHRRARPADLRDVLRVRAGRGAVALRGLLAPGHRGHELRHPPRRHQRRRPARGRRQRQRDGARRAPRRRRGPRRQDRHGPRRSRRCGPASAPPAASG